MDIVSLRTAHIGDTGVAGVRRIRRIRRPFQRIEKRKHEKGSISPSLRVSVHLSLPVSVSLFLSRLFSPRAHW